MSISTTMTMRVKSDLIRIFAENLKRTRQMRGLSQEQLADIAELDRSYVSSCERGQRNATVKTLERLAAALGVPASQLLEPPHD